MPRTFIRATDRVLALTAVVVFLLALLNREWADWLNLRWAGISPLWALLPIGLLVVYRLLLLNEQEMRALEGEIAMLADESTAAESREHLVTRLEHEITRGSRILTLLDQDYVSDVKMAEAREWAKDVEMLLRREAPALVGRFCAQVPDPFEGVQDTPLGLPGPAKGRVRARSAHRERLERLRAFLVEL